MSSQFKPWLLLSIIFIVGVITGSALTIGLGPRFIHPPGQLPMKHHWMDYLTHQLNLTADQQAEIEPVVTDATTRIQSLHRDDVERDSAIFKTADERISAFLTPDQKVKFQKMESEREKMFSGHLHPWAPHGGPGGMHHHDGTNDSGEAPPLPPSPGASTNAPPQKP